MMECIFSVLEYMTHKFLRQRHIEKQLKDHKEPFTKDFGEQDRSSEPKMLDRVLLNFSHVLSRDAIDQVLFKLCANIPFLSIHWIPTALSDVSSLDFSYRDFYLPVTIRGTKIQLSSGPNIGTAVELAQILLQRLTERILQNLYVVACFHLGKDAVIKKTSQIELTLPDQKSQVIIRVVPNENFTDFIIVTHEKTEKLKPQIHFTSFPGREPIEKLEYYLKTLKKEPTLEKDL